MKVLVVGQGGREHAMAWKIAQSDQVTAVFVAPGNAGTSLEEKVSNIAIDALDINGLIHFARNNAIDLTVIGPEAPLVAGIVDQFNEAGLRCFGPSQAAAQLEGSKAFSKDFLARFSIPTAEYQVFNEIEPAKQYLQAKGVPIVIKADGLAAGKGVVVAWSTEEATTAIDDMLGVNRFGDAGHRIVIEEFLQGEEASFMVMCDGKSIVPFATSQDHKARDDGDQGPNTGGMGAYSPAPVIDEEMHEKIMRTVIEPTIEGLAQEGITYTGFLYAGIMITATGPKVLEFNCRLGDPETQPLLFRLKSDFAKACLAATEQQLTEDALVWDERVALGVVLAAQGYPEQYPTGEVISGLDHTLIQTEAKVFHAGTRLNTEGQVVTAGGRVLCATALGINVKEAQEKAYAASENVTWPNKYQRSDIGYRAINREN
ncbi:Phosphoribosylamine--glycine ligase [Piscirickettsia salmonis]|uniref:Phosphoribosylamine--glycine ligase n=1 Tax=Piscirickettsia salmonis TaxID=1238 RepID=A0A9Q6LIB8_PISSA|nr:phosphoribosylamine--glycine ligase [Piscirickettsia salmonis]QGN93669.1 Phosphoribosylamine--glycine ligase [Piscirickettsia salmonis]QGO04365.1 Phosphoribosylamine--glycine ligase [Piscirickettsia salmonis]QGO32934.1 Phosphoribosylamine--glycine ligase [Piscirickettsia salmonis]QGO36547.1 Phosphoribosylamine--glycine ligase [Piscirickettsia salmonis]QGO40171.1 Phosphoribosylamine--glycine ligase [Piscirickettsia salmonis]